MFWTHRNKARRETGGACSLDLVSASLADAEFSSSAMRADFLRPKKPLCGLEASTRGGFSVVLERGSEVAEEAFSSFLGGRREVGRESAMAGRAAKDWNALYEGKGKGVERTKCGCRQQDVRTFLMAYLWPGQAARES